MIRDIMRAFWVSIFLPSLRAALDRLPHFVIHVYPSIEGFHRLFEVRLFSPENQMTLVAMRICTN